MARLRRYTLTSVAVTLFLPAGTSAFTSPSNIAGYDLRAAVDVTERTANTHTDSYTPDVPLFLELADTGQIVIIQHQSNALTSGLDLFPYAQKLAKLAVG